MKIGTVGRRIFTLPFQNGLEYWNADWQIKTAFNVATLCTNSLRFGAVTLKKRLLIFVLV